MSNRPLSRTEAKILVYNKVRHGMSYTEACKEVAAEIAQLQAAREQAKAKEQPEEKKLDFKTEFTELTRRKKE